ncbi:MAG: hypothetical protein ACRCYA_05340 [Cetobacterium sp.]|uniref:hypothetical protein n=1 Tax=Cetobacterium sp. TaxID=2071632 RepID=UPI003EE7BE90
MKVKDKVEVVSYWEELKGEIGEVVELKGERVLVYFSKLEEGKEISFGVRLHNGFVSGRVKKHLFIQKQHLKVVETENDIKNAIFNININFKDTPCMFAFEKLRVINPERFASGYCLQFGTGTNGVYFSEDVKEDKMEDVRVVKAWEDLVGLENKNGSKINGEHNVCFMGDVVTNSTDYYLEDYVKLLKAMGFKFEYKTLRTIEEVKEEISNLENRKFSTERIFNYYIDLDHNDNKYKVDYCDCYETLGAIYMTEEQAKKYVTELNEIIGVGK